MEELKIYTFDAQTNLELPFAEEGVRAGFPSPAQDFLSESIDLNRDLITHAESTFYARVVGDSLRDANVHEGDILIVDKSIDPTDGSMAICCVDGDFTLKFIERHSDHMLLRSANPAYQPIRVTSEEYFKVWGVVTYIIHKVTHRNGGRSC